jgi:hypothetical protein
MTDHPEVTDVGPYVLGALDPHERAAVDAHLRGCARCRQELAELADLPPLLALVPADVAAALAEDDVDLDPPDSVLGTLVRAARAEEARARRRRRWATGLAAAAVVAVLAVGWLARPWGPSQEQPTAVALAPVQGVSVPVSVDVALTSTDWGTRLMVTCAYLEDGPAAPASSYGEDAGYALVLTDADGVSEQVATWGVVPGHDVVVPAATRLGAGEIARIDLRSVGGPTLMSAEP